MTDFARESSKYRPAALATLGVTMKTSFDVDAELRKLLSEPNIETRYGAFRALWTRNPTDYMIQGENMADQFSYHCLNSGGPSYVHITQSARPEIVLFNADQIYLRGEVDVEANPRLTIRTEDNDVIVKRYESGDGIDEQRRVSYKVDDVIRALVELGGTYPDVVSFLTQAKTKKLLYASDSGSEAAECPLAIDALPGYKAGVFKKVRDVEAVVKSEEARERAERQAKESETKWYNPGTWFAKKSDGGSSDFSLEEFDAANSAESDGAFEGGDAFEAPDESEDDGESSAAL